MSQRCPHCQTRPLRAGTTVCWYCGRNYVATPDQLRPLRPAPRVRPEPRTPKRAASVREPSGVT